MLLLAKLVIWTALAISCGHIADLKGRNQIFWSIVGFFIGIWGVVIIALLPDKKFRW